MDEKLPRVSIITPSFNQGQFIEKTILSVINQDYANIEYIVMDGSSTDNTVEILKRYEDKLIWESKPDRGQSHAINKGFKMAKGEIIGWLNSDDTYEPGAIRTVVSYFLNHPEADVVFGDGGRIDESGKKIGVYKAGPVNLRRWLYHGEIYVSQPSTFFRRSVIDRIGGLDLTLHINMDHDYWIRMAQTGLVMRHIHVHLGNLRLHQETKTQSVLGLYSTYHLRLLKRYGIVPYMFYYLRHIAMIKLKKLLFGTKPIFRKERHFGPHMYVTATPKEPRKSVCSRNWGQDSLLEASRSREIASMQARPHVQIKFSLELAPAQVTSFLSEVFRTPGYFSAPLWTWKHMENPFGASRFWTAWDSDQLIGVRPLWAWRLKLGIEEVAAFQCVDTAVSAAYRGRGIFSCLVRRMLEESDNVLIFNFPNSSSFPGYMKLGWVALPALRTFVRPLSFIGLTKSVFYRGLKHFRNQPSVPFKPLVASLSSFLERLQCPKMIGHLEQLLFSYRSSLSQKLTTDIDVPYLLWRYSDPTRAPFYSMELWDDGQLVALLVYRVAHVGGLDVAFLYDALLDFSNQGMLLHVFRAAFAELRPIVDEVRCILSQGHPLYEVYSTLGFFSRGTTNFVVNPSRLARSLPWDDAKKWAICGSALDSW